ncbi:MarR family winged helix-turn-helix transcriptional regulator [Marinococcus halophilus]|uniref:MarR family winged helix-turn-helix transcriptional regulator n=1 Tax=Marinococcus halophilus TaxID=1371 RepID=UPI001FD2A16B|nr:MarR family transcriptional regulator [Marinococcus halophilus]
MNKIRLGLLLWFRLSRVYEQNLSRSAAHLKQAGLSPPQFDILAQVHAHQPITQKELAGKLFVTKGSVTYLLKKLEDENLVTRRQTWKEKHISLTPKGSRTLEEVAPGQEHFQAAQFDSLTAAEKRELLRLLRKLQKTTEQEET